MSKFANLRMKVEGELPCHGGSGRFGLLPDLEKDEDEDGDAFLALTPVLISGNHLDATHSMATLSTGTAGAAYRWATDGMEADQDFAWPVVDMVWQCAMDYSAQDVATVDRPDKAYRFRTHDLDDDWNQEILVRPDFEAMKLWFELRGYPRATAVTNLTGPVSGQYAFDVDFAGVLLSGWVKSVGQPVGSKLRLHLDTASYGTWSVSDETLPDLLKLP